MTDKIFRINSYLGMVAAMRLANFVSYEITCRDEIYVVLRMGYPTKL